MSKKSWLVFFCCLFTLVFFSTANAQKEKWVDKNYDFTQIKVILAEEPQLTDKASPIAAKVLAEDFYDRLTSFDKAKIITRKDIFNSVKEKSGDDLEELFATDSKKADVIYKEAVAKYADAVLSTDIYEYTVGKKRVEAQIQYRYERVEERRYGPNGEVTTGWVEQRVPYIVPAHDVTVLRASVRFNLSSVKNPANPILSIGDSRERTEDSFGSATPENMYKRILNDFCKELAGHFK